MPIILNIYSLEDVKQENKIVSLSEGAHIIGRGELLKITDKRVSRKHAIIEITEEKIILTSVHVNPCFVRAAIQNANTIIIKENENAELNNGDLFGLLPSDCWFKVSKIESARKRQLPSEKETSDSQSKQQKQCENNNKNDQSSMINQENKQVTGNTSMEIPTDINNGVESPFQIRLNQGQLPSTSSVDNANNNEIAPSAVKEENTGEEGIAASEADGENATKRIKTEVKEEPNDDIKTEPSETPSQNGLLQAQTQLNNNQTLGTSDLNNVTPTTLINQPTRERCWYGQNCYRKNPNHRASFSHPGDHDYGNDATTLPECPFGTACYRRHPEHRRQYRHTTGPANVPSPSNSNYFINVTSGYCPFCEHCRQRTDKSDH